MGWSRRAAGEPNPRRNENMKTPHWKVPGLGIDQASFLLWCNSANHCNVCNVFTFRVFASCKLDTFLGCLMKGFISETKCNLWLWIWWNMSMLVWHELHFLPGGNCHTSVQQYWCPFVIKYHQTFDTVLRSSFLVLNLFRFYYFDGCGGNPVVIIVIWWRFPQHCDSW